MNLRDWRTWIARLAAETGKTEDEILNATLRLARAKGWI